MMNQLTRSAQIPSLVLTLMLMVLPASLLQSQTRPTIAPRLQKFFDEHGLLRELMPRPDDQKGSAGSTLLSVPGDENWVEGFGENLGSSGVNDEVFAMAATNKLIYIAGSFSKAGDLNVNNIVSWNGQNWDYAGSGPGALNGVTGIINTLAIDSVAGRMYVGGQFKTVSPAVQTENLASYDILSRSWLRFADVTSTTGNAFVSTILVYGDSVFIGGTFDKVNNTVAHGIALYNKGNRTWSALDDVDRGVQGNVNTIIKGPDGIYVGGNFSSAGGVPVQSLAIWKPGSGWQNLSAGGVRGAVNALAVIDSVVFVGGEFDRAGDTVVRNIAKWHVDSARWNRLSGYFWLQADSSVRLEGNGVDGAVRSFFVDDHDLYVGGTFFEAYPGDFTTSPIAARYIARWHENVGNPLFYLKWWAPLSRGMDGFVNTLARFDGSLYAGGNFTKASGQPALGVARWDGVRWNSLATGIGDIVSTIAVDSGGVYVGGEFNQPTGKRGTRVARLDGTFWRLLPDQFFGSIFNVSTKDQYVYAAGGFNGVGLSKAVNIARFDRSMQTWSQLGEKKGPDNDEQTGYVSAVAFDGDYVYMGGDFTNVDGMPAYNIVRWNSATDEWEAIGGGINGEVFAIVIDGDRIFVGGRFLGAGSDDRARNIAVFENGDWHGIGVGVDKTIWTMAQVGEKIYVGGDFDSVGTKGISHLAALDRTTLEWSELGGGIHNSFLPSVNAMTVNQGNLYIGGSFDTVGTTPASNIAKWNGSWIPLGSGVDNFVFGMASYEKRIYVTGAFLEAGGIPSYYFGIYNDVSLSVDADRSADGGNSILDLSAGPNPMQSDATISFDIARSGHVNLEVYNENGERVARLIDNQLHGGTYQVRWAPDASLPAGTYFISLRQEGNRLTTRVIRR